MNERIRQYGETAHKRYLNGENIPVWKGKHHNEKTKLKISKSRSEYLINHPDEHPWKRNTKFKSVPCEKFKNDLRKLGYAFEEEYTDSSWTHNYSIDIAFPEKKIGIEINGQQHYDKNGNLNEYNRNRQSYLEKLRMDNYKHSLCISL